MPRSAVLAQDAAVNKEEKNNLTSGTGAELVPARAVLWCRCQCGGHRQQDPVAPTCQNANSTMSAIWQTFRSHEVMDRVWRKSKRLCKDNEKTPLLLEIGTEMYEPVLNLLSLTRVLTWGRRRARPWHPMSHKALHAHGSCDVSQWRCMYK